MALTVTITLTDAGLDTGPFNLYSNIDGFLVPFETSVSKANLLLGYLSVVVPDNTTTIRVLSTGVLCPNYVDLDISGITTTTTTSTSTTTTTSTTVYPCLEGPYSYYLADVYTCTECTPGATGVVVALPTAITAVINDYYAPCLDDGNVYRITATTTEAVAIILTNSHDPVCASVPCVV